jgi:hypothetical protein
MLAISSLAWVAMLRQLCVVFATAGVLLRPSDKIFLLAPFPQLARAVSSRGALKGELLVRVRNMGRISSRSTSF